MSGPTIDGDCPEEGEEEHSTTTVSQSDRLPEETSPPEKEKHITRAGIEIVKGETGIERDGNKDRVDSCRRDTDSEDVTNKSDSNLVMISTSSCTSN
jgi:hypothetical protein